MKEIVNDKEIKDLFTRLNIRFVNDLTSDINEYGKALFRKVQQARPTEVLRFVRATSQPFGIKVLDSTNTLHHLKVILNDGTLDLECKSTTLLK